MDDHERSKPKPREALLREQAEKYLSDTSPFVSDLSPEALLHELQVHQIELEMQNEALRQTQIELEESRDRYVDLYEFAPVAYLTLSRVARIVEINLSGAALLREDRKKLLGRRFDRFIIPAEKDRWFRFFMQATQKIGENQTFEMHLQCSDGTKLLAHLYCLPFEQTNTEKALRVSLTDITEQKRIEEELRISAIAFESQEGMIVTDTNGVIVRVNNAFTQLTGYTAEEVMGHTPAILKSERQVPEFYSLMWKILKEKGYWQGEVWSKRKDGKIYVEWRTISAVKGVDGSPTHYVGAFSDITKNKQAEAEIHRLAYYDDLTHLPNRRLFLDRLDQAMANGKRQRRYGALLFIDLDNFKDINDTLGHPVGDQLLIGIGHRLQSNIREGDTVARMGGDEFVIILENLSRELPEAVTQTALVIEKIWKALEDPFIINEKRLSCTSSAGISLFYNHDEPSESVLKQADLALYKAKNAGRNCQRFYDPAMQIAMDERSALESDLRLALSHKEFYLYFQPQVDSSHRLLGAEALLRWQHPHRGLVLPEQFISLAEEVGLILSIGEWVLKTACAQIKKWSTGTKTRKLKIAVNVSARQLHQSGFVAQVEQILTETGIDPTRLKIELTESMVLQDIEETIKTMNALKRIGIGFSMDDFGTGYSSLSYLTRLPLEQLKIDQSFVFNLPDNVNDGIIAQTIITMGRSLGLEVIAEGVESEAQHAFLSKIGCYAYQGYLFSKPLPMRSFEAFMRRKKIKSTTLDAAR